MTLSAAACAPRESDLLGAIGASELPIPLDVEFSIHLSPGRIEDRGRYVLWYAAAAAGPAQRLLDRLGAPPELTSSLPALPLRRFGIGVGGSREFRLYLHGRDARLLDTYVAYRWTRETGATERADYRCHLLPEAVTGETPGPLVHPQFREAVGRMIETCDPTELPAFWLRSRRERVDQVDLAFPNHPPAGSLPGFDALLKRLELDRIGSARLAALPVRHLAFTTGDQPPRMTMYVSGACGTRPPVTETALREQAVDGARRQRRATVRELARLPAPPECEDAVDLGAFYGGDIPTWQSVLGVDLHYHHGLFVADDEPFEEAAQRAVRELYPLIPAGERLYDIGCGWGGPVAMIVHDLRCPSVGITVSRAQYRHVGNLGYRARWGDAAFLTPLGHFGCALMLESLEHIADKERFLRRLRPFADRLVMRVNCQDASPPGPAFGGSMHMVASEALRGLLERAGWTVRHWRDRRAETLPSQVRWQERLDRLPNAAFEADPHLRVFREWCARVLSDQDAWARNNPLIEVAAD